MSDSENTKPEFAIPTRYRFKIGSYLSWPTGAKELTEALLHIPQIKNLDLRFSGSYPKFPQGKWPVSFIILEAKYSRPYYTHLLDESEWGLSIRPVPRILRAEIRKLLIPEGLKTLESWLRENAILSGSESYKRYSCVWNSESKELTFKSYSNILPDVAVEKGKSKK